jgi:ADP-ribosylglycohydrolase
MLTRTQIVDKKDLYIDRARSALIGLAIGDVMGDLGRDNDVRLQYGLATELLPHGQSTDDTEFCVLSARCFLNCDGEYTAQKVAACWRKLVTEKGGALERAGIPLYGALWNLAQGIDPPQSGTDNALHEDDGAAMRAVPFGIVAAGDPDEAARLAAIDASISHAGDGIHAAAAIAASMSVAILGAPFPEVIATGRNYIPADSWLGRRMELALDIADNSEDLFYAYKELHTRLWTPKHSVAAEAIPQMYALYKLAEGDFRKGLIYAANFGRDADTICALVASLTAAAKGMTVIPPDWVEQVRRPSGVCLAFTVGEDLLDLGLELVERVVADMEKS